MRNLLKSKQSSSLFWGTGLLAVSLISGCATTPRQPPSFANLGQFEQYQLNTAIFRIRFVGDPNMSQGTAEEIALVKAAKTTLDAGYRYFYVLNESKAPRNRRTLVYPDTFYSSPWYGPYAPYRARWPYYQGWNDPFYHATVYNLDPVDISYTIKCSHQPSAQQEEFDARLIVSTLGAKYYLSPDSSASQSAALSLPQASTANTAKQSDK